MLRTIITKAKNHAKSLTGNEFTKAPIFVLSEVNQIKGTIAKLNWKLKIT